uniref:Putative secreted protein n=1 Tax=Anopheles marajoara TaxID=58244 RepID=A0A2M4CFM1_9DIPT
MLIPMLLLLLFGWLILAHYRPVTTFSRHEQEQKNESQGSTPRLGWEVFPELIVRVSHDRSSRGRLGV